MRLALYNIYTTVMCQQPDLHVLIQINSDIYRE